MHKRARNQVYLVIIDKANTEDRKFYQNINGHVWKHEYKKWPKYEPQGKRLN